MPNWCLNSATFHHKNPEMIQKLADAFKRGDVCETFAPIEEEWAKLTADPNFSDPSNSIRVKFQIDHWGTKWDFGEDVDLYIDLEEGRLQAPYFDTAWSPPIGLYNKLLELGFEVFAYYFEAGCAFYGTYDNGSDVCGEIKEASDIPDEIRDTFDTDPYYQYNEEDSEEDEENADS